jgi:hypothetical protein
MNSTSQPKVTTAQNLETKFDRGKDVLDYFDVSKARVIRPQSKSITKTNVGWAPKRNSQRSAVVREKSARYRKKTSSPCVSGVAQARGRANPNPYHCPIISRL